MAARSQPGLLCGFPRPPRKSVRFRCAQVRVIWRRQGNKLAPPSRPHACYREQPRKHSEDRWVHPPVWLVQVPTEREQQKIEQEPKSDPLDLAAIERSTEPLRAVPPNSTHHDANDVRSRSGRALGCPPATRIDTNGLAGVRARLSHSGTTSRVRQTTAAASDTFPRGRTMVIAPTTPCAVPIADLGFRRSLQHPS
jgi:hypothetical protein